MEKKLNILVIDDRINTIKGTLRKLERLGHKITRSLDFQHAKENLRSEKFDLLLLDWKIDWSDEEFRSKGEYGGNTLFEMLRNGELGDLNRELKAAVVTAYLNLVDTEKLHNLGGFAGKLFKLRPSEIEDLVKKLSDEEK